MLRCDAIMICRKFGVLHRVLVLGLDRKVGLCYQTFQHADVLLVTCEECLIGEQEYAITEVRVEIAGQVLRVDMAMAC